MFVYLAVFAVTTALYAVADKQKKVRALLIAAALIIPSVIAGLRAASVGTDVMVYGISFFERARSSGNILSFLSLQNSMGHQDNGYNILVYIISIFTGDCKWSFFFFELITLSVAYLAVVRCKKLFDTPVWLGMLLFELSLYNTSFNNMRQLISISFVFLGMTYLFENKYRYYFLLTIVGFLFHSSGVIGLLILPVYLLIKSRRGRSELEQLIAVMIASAIIAVLVLGMDTIARFLVNQGILRSNYLKYLAGGSFASSGSRSVDLINLVLQSAILFFIAISFRKMQRMNYQPVFFIVSSALVLTITCFGPLVASYISRIGYYLIPIQMIGLINTRFIFDKKSRPIWIVFIIALVGVIWFKTIVIQNYGETMPYLFYWQGA